MQRLIKFLHTMGAIGLMGAMMSLLVLLCRSRVLSRSTGDSSFAALPIKGRDDLRAWR
jgi:hypothetical protein